MVMGDITLVMEKQEAVLVAVPHIPALAGLTEAVLGKVVGMLVMVGSVLYA
jgi:hypothetical protein